MRKIIPFEGINDAITSLDNGGRFYNLLTKANDGNISASELEKVAGVFSDKQKAVLYFAMSISELKGNPREQIETSLTADLNLAYNRYLPQELQASEAESKGIVSSNAIITGIPKMVDSKAGLKGFIMVSTGKTLAMIPIMDRYEVYEIRDNGSANTFLIAHSKGSEKLPEKTIKVGGIIKGLKKAQTEDPKKFLEALYYCDID